MSNRRQLNASGPYPCDDSAHAARAPTQGRARGVASQWLTTETRGAHEHLDTSLCVLSRFATPPSLAWTFFSAVPTRSLTGLWAHTQLRADVWAHTQLRAVMSLRWTQRWGTLLAQTEPLRALPANAMFDIAVSKLKVYHENRYICPPSRLEYQISPVLRTFRRCSVKNVVYDRSF